MMLKFVLLLLVANAFLDVSAEKHSFVGYKLLRLNPVEESHFELIREWEHNPEFDFWSRKIGTVDVLLSPEALKKYEKLFKAAGIDYSILKDNIQEQIDMETKSMESMKGKRQSKSIVGKFARYSEINNFIKDIVSSNGDIASSYLAGRTYEKRDINIIVFKTATSSRSIFIDCGFHAREWIAVSSCVWIMDKIVKDYQNGDVLLKSILAKYEIHIAPLVNPDGYEYSHDTFRMWRKNRKLNPGSACVGVDLNRNFGYKWRTGGSSTNPCSDTYAGPSADSELETLALEKAILVKKGNWDAYLTIHTYGQYWLCSWSYSTTVYPDDFAEVCAKAKIGADGIKTFAGTPYTTGHSGVLFGALSGVSDDWAKGNATIKYSYTLELSPGQSTDSGYGFQLPEDRAPRVGQETYIGITTFLK
jgi:hypothetical protein